MIQSPSRLCPASTESDRPRSWIHAHLRLLRDLVAIDSGQSVAGAGRRRRRRRSRTRSPRTCAGSASTSNVQEVAPGRPNVIGVLEGRARGRSLMFCGHIDTVGVEGMTAPFDPRRARRPAVRPRRAGHEGRRRRDDRRGARRRGRRVRARPAHRRRGRRRGVREHRRRRAGHALARRRAPSSPSRPICRSAIGHKGFAWVEVETRGRAAHGSRPADGRDAILRMGRVLARARALDRELQARAAASAAGHGVAARVDHRGRPRAEQLSGSRAAAAGAAHGARRDGTTPVAAEIEAIAGAAARRRIAEFEASVTAAVLRGRLRDCRDGIRCRAALGARRAAAAIDRRRFVGMSFWTDAAVLGERRHSVGAVRARRRRPPQRRGIRQRQRRACVPRRAGGACAAAWCAADRRSRA